MTLSSKARVINGAERSDAVLEFERVARSASRREFVRVWRTIGRAVFIVLSLSRVLLRRSFASAFRRPIGLGEYYRLRVSRYAAPTSVLQV